MKLSKESAAERKAKAAFSEADKLKAQSSVENMKAPGVYIDGKQVKKLSASEAKLLFKAENN